MSYSGDEEATPRKPRRATTLPVRFEDPPESSRGGQRPPGMSNLRPGYGRNEPVPDVSPVYEYSTYGDAENEKWRRAPPLPRTPRTSSPRSDIRRERYSPSPDRRVPPIRGQFTYNDYSEVEQEMRSRRTPVRYPTQDDYDEIPATSRKRVRYAGIDNYDRDSRRRSRSPSAPPPPHARPETRSGYAYPESPHYYAPRHFRATAFRDPDDYADSPVIINNRIYNDFDDDEQRYFPVHSQSRSRLHRPSSPATAPVLTNNRTYDDVEEEIDIYARKPTPGKAYGGYPRTPVIINNAIASDLDDDLDDEDQYLIAKAFTFSLSGHLSNPMDSESSINSMTEAEISDTTGNFKDTNQGVSIGQYHEVLRSNYTGDGTIGGDQSAELTVVNEDHSTQQNHSLFRWIHFEDSAMDFDRFESNVATISRLTDAERRGLSAVLGRARKFDKPSQVSRGVKARFMAPSIIHESVLQANDSKSSKTGLATWMCLPYFCLEKYPSLDLSALKLRPSSHPMKTLLQTRFSLVQKERDMRQAVCQLNDTSAGYCYHIAHLWCLVLDDSLLITCSRFPHKVLQADSISIVAEPSSNGPNPSSPHIRVSRGKSNVWAFRLEDCLTWFGFISHFWEFWPQTLQFTYKDKVLEQNDWIRLLALAKKSTIHIELTIHPKEALRDQPSRPLEIIIPVFDEKASFRVYTQISSKESTPKTSIEEVIHTKKSHADVVTDKSPTKLAPTPESKNFDGTLQDRSPSRSRDQKHEVFHVFTWMNTKPVRDETQNLTRSVPGSSPHRNSSEHSENCTNDANVIRDLEEIDRFLSKESNAKDRLAYNQCESISRKKVYDLLIEAGTTLLRKPGQTGKQRTFFYNTQLEILEQSEALFQFFLPFSFEVATAQKYWGALYRFLNSMPLRVLDDDDDDLYDDTRETVLFQSWINTVTRHMKPFKDFLDLAHHIDRAKFHLPEEFSKAWLHLVMSMVRAGDKAFNSHIIVCDELLSVGIRKVFKAFPQKSLTESSVLTPFDLVSLINLHLLNDIHHTANERDLCDTYWEYLKALEDEVEANPLDRSHQDRITMLKQEISVIKDTLLIQRNMFTIDRHSGAGRLGASEGIAPRNEGITSLDHRSRSKIREYEFQSLSGRNRLSPTEPNALQGLLVQDSIVLLDKRLVDFKQIEDRARDLETWNIQKIDSNKDRQDSAIFAFTIVTVIFLPLSTIASILGMNTNDIRNMEVDQWVFWIVAVPLLIIVVLVCLVWTGELRHGMGVVGRVWRATTDGRRRRRLGLGTERMAYVDERRYEIEGEYYRPQRQHRQVEERRRPPPPSPYYRT